MRYWLLGSNDSKAEPRTMTCVTTGYPTVQGVMTHTWLTAYWSSYCELSEMSRGSSCGRALGCSGLA